MSQVFKDIKEWHCSEPKEIIITHSYSLLLTSRVSDSSAYWLICRGNENSLHMSVSSKPMFRDKDPLHTSVNWEAVHKEVE